MKSTSPRFLAVPRLTVAALLLGALAHVPAADAAVLLRCGGKKPTIVGTHGTDVIRGTSKRDVIVALGGADKIRAGGGNDIVCAGGGDDEIEGGIGADVIYGQSGDDDIDAGAGNDRKVDGGTGNDRIRGGHGVDTLKGGDGDDRITSGGGAAVGGHLLGEGGNDTLTAQSKGVAVLGGDGDDKLFSTKPNTRFQGNNGNDTITGSEFPDDISGGAGDDTIDAGGGDDIAVAGGEGNDTIGGGAGNDRLLGEGGADTCSGGDGNDVCHGGSPGTDENTPEDTDRCDDTAETRISCWEKGLPVRFVGEFNGVTTQRNGDSTSTVRWTFQTVSTLSNNVTDCGASGDCSQVRAIYRADEGTGTFIGDGTSGSCTYSDGGAMEAGILYTHLEIEADRGPWYFLEVGGDETEEVTWTCPTSSRIGLVSLIGPLRSEAVWDPRTGVLSGSAVRGAGEDTVVEWSFKLTAQY